MLPRRPRLRVDSLPNVGDTRKSRIRGDSQSSSDSHSRQPPSSFPQTPVYSRVSSFRSLQMEVQIYSNSVKAAQQEGYEGTKPLPVFGDHDQISGKVILDPSCSHSGRLSIDVEGAFLYPSSTMDRQEESSYTPNSGKRKHVFFSSSTNLVVSSAPEYSNTPRSAFREAFAASVRRRPSLQSMNPPATPVDRSYPFSFDLPRSLRSGEEMPHSFSSFDATASSGLPGRSATAFEVSYKVIVSWEPSASNRSENRSFLDIPILFQPDTDFQSLDGIPPHPDSWLEMPLSPDRPVPFRCAATLPSPVSFSRSGSIPYFVVFTTTPRSSALAREIASDATISVCLLRQITINETPALPPTPPQTPSTSGEESDTPRNNLLRRVVKNRPPLLSRTSRALDELEVKDKPLPRLPTQTTYSDSQTLQTSMCIGFPKRPRNRCDPQSHPSLDTHTSLPDGLHKGKIQLNRKMLQCIDWDGISVKYYLEVSVLVGQDHLRARIPIRLF